MFKSITIFGACLALFAGPSFSQGPEDVPPNVVLIGLREMSSTLLEVGPNLQGLMAQGAVIPNGEVTAPRGQPELAVLMTGLTPQQSGVRLSINHPKLDSTTTIMDLLQSEGYANFGAGFAPAPWAELAFEATHDEINPLSLEGRSDLFTRIEELAPEQPFFLWWCPKPLAQGDGMQREEAESADRQLGSLVEGLKRSGRHENTLYVIVSTGAANNNPERRRMRPGARQAPMVFAYGDHFKGGQVYDALASTLDIVPTILDFANCDTAGLKLNGESLRPMLEGGPPLDRERVYGALYSAPEGTVHPRALRDPNLRTLTHLYSRDRRWKYVLYLVDVRQIVDSSKLGFLFSAGDQELFDLEQDPEQKLNLAGVPANADRLRQLRKDLFAWWESSGAARPPLGRYLTPLEPKLRGDRQKDARPNIVLIISDDHDGGHFGFLGNDNVKMPVLDKLAEGGTVFTTAHVSSSRSRPSLAGLLTGRYPKQNKVTSNGARVTLRTKNSLPNLLKQSGYATYMGGRFLEENRYAMGFTSPQWEQVDKFVRRDQKSLWEFLDAQASKRPFFIWWAPSIPSEPFNAPPRFVNEFKDTEIEVPKKFTGNRYDYVRQELAVMAMESWFDAELGRLVDHIDELGQLDNTLFCFVSDNGSSNMRPSRGSTFEKGLHTPIVFNLKGKVKPGVKLDQLTSSLDIFPTLLDFAGVPIPSGIAGHSLKETLEGGISDPQSERAALFGAGYRAPRPKGRHTPDMDVYSVYVRDKEWKYVFYVRNVTQENTSILAPVGLFPRRTAGIEELFNLKDDPYEYANLAKAPENAERVKRMHAMAIDWWLETGGKPSKLLKR